MAKFWGKFGFVVTAETVPGVWSDVETERDYTGDLLRNSARWEAEDKVHGDIVVNNHISVVMDDWISDPEHLSALRYVKFGNAHTKWAVTSVTMDWPRITINLGGEYKG